MLVKVFAINGSPRKGKGHTGMLLKAFIAGLRDGGAEAEVYYTKDLKPKPCTGEMRCWWETPGECYIKDDMQKVYPKLREADILIMATPVYIPLPGEMQIFVNRLCPLMKPLLETREGRTRGRLHDDVKLCKVLLISTGGWWEKENFDTVVHIAREFTENCSIEFVGAMLRPHAFLMRRKGEVTGHGAKIIQAVERAGKDFVKDGQLGAKILETISRPLISRDELLQRYNRLLESR
jgi:multimeric flavodoxin WrbA